MACFVMFISTGTTIQTVFEVENLFILYAMQKEMYANNFHLCNENSKTISLKIISNRHIRNFQQRTLTTLCELKKFNKVKLIKIYV